MRKFLFILFISTGTWSSTQAQQENKVPAPAYDTLLYSVIPYQYKMNLDWVFGKDATGASLSPAEIVKVDSLLMKAFTSHQEKNPVDSPLHLLQQNRYFRQLVPVTDAAGKKQVLVNCFCDPWLNWKKQLVYVADGGNCYFKLIIFLTDQTNTAISVNGSG